MVILIDTKYFARELHKARRSLRLNAAEVAQIFKIPPRKYRRYESGKEPIPETILHSLFCNGFCLMRCRKK